jgi:uncharacterized protein (DUF433 family)
MDRVVSNPAICGGKPTIRGTRIMVRNIIDVLALDGSIQAVLINYPDLTEDDVKAALAYAGELVDETRLITKAS